MLFRSLYRLQATREKLSAQVAELINTLGPEMFPDFDSARIIADPFREGSVTPHTSAPSTPTSGRDEKHDGVPYIRTSTPHSDAERAEGLPRNESFHNIGNIGIFATRPSSRNRSRSSSAGGGFGSGGFPIKGFSTLDGKTGFEEVSKKIRGAMKERGERRRRGKSEQGSDREMTDDELRKAI